MSTKHPFESVEASADVMKLAEMILSDCGQSTVISDRLQRRVAGRIQQHMDSTLGGQQQAEPVAWMMFDRHGTRTGWTSEKEYTRHAFRSVPLYAQPPAVAVPGRLSYKNATQEFADGYNACIDAILAAVPQATAEDSSVVGGAGAAPAEWPTEQDVGRIGDMSKVASLRVGLDADSDVYVCIHGEAGSGSVEFCVPGSGGGKSPRTRAALISLMVAMEADNAESPSHDWWKAREGDEQKGGEA